ncbi:MAG TPA: hypothetical protein PK234_01420 [Candidatus Portnoybacteria bacterium]|jgi:hypothetical protein|nr:hypothetical protein [Candidatus Portnoybacteria bacterium]MDD5752423.1 hypothetical protein [Candidatus Portnoybacteria bacterium]HOZ16514.1 hypothetical protein [Candidatus Portnoybacteria bacterium]HPH52274.1 hypothetical protein [Candidatus Portnoybacteria bacterium]HPM28416.1 hypothetical protein [Candidatus Portnoybacteria bacterium]
MYKCSQCDYKSENPGTCPTHNIELVLETPEESIPSEENLSEEIAPETSQENLVSEEPKTEE